MDDTRISTGTGGDEPPPRERSLPEEPSRSPEASSGQRRDSYRVYQKDQQALKLLVIFHFVLAGVSCFLGLCPLSGVGLGIFMLTTPFPTPPGGAPPGPSPALMGGIIIAEYSFFALLIYGSAIVGGLVGHFLRQRRAGRFGIIGAGILCLFMPLGTTLGVFTIIVLARESVKDVFQHGAVKTTDDEDYA